MSAPTKSKLPGARAERRLAVPVTADNFCRAETDMYFGMFVSRGALGKFIHLRELPLKSRGVRPNRDTLYSQAVFDLDAGPVTITLPDAGTRFTSLMAIDQDHYVRDFSYGAGAHTYTRELIGTRYLFTACRTLVDPASPEDLKKVHALQDSVTATQPRGPGRFEVPNWDKASQKKIRDAGRIANCLPIISGWNYMVRLYRPRPRILDRPSKLRKTRRVDPPTIIEMS